MKDCPDLTAMSTAERADFWSQTDPRELRRLGDRLLAECLPIYEHSVARELLSQQVVNSREEAGWSRAEVADFLGVTESLVQAWEEDEVKTPDSLPLVLARLSRLVTQAE